MTNGSSNISSTSLYRVTTLLPLSASSLGQSTIKAFYERPNRVMDVAIVHNTHIPMLLLLNWIVV